MMPILLVLILLSGCGIVTENRVVAEREPVRPLFIPERSYSRAEIDAINAETACRNLARTIVQMERCSIRR